MMGFNVAELVVIFAVNPLMDRLPAKHMMWSAVIADRVFAHAAIKLHKRDRLPIPDTDRLGKYWRLAIPVLYFEDKWSKAWPIHDRSFYNRIGFFMFDRDFLMLDSGDLNLVANEAPFAEPV